MTEAEVHAFGISAVLPSIAKEGVTIHSVTEKLGEDPQVVGERWGRRAFIAVRTRCYPEHGALTSVEATRLIAWADRHNATCFFASVGIACMAYPDRTEVIEESDRSQPFRNAGFAVAYEGLVVLTSRDRVTSLSDTLRSTDK